MVEIASGDTLVEPVVPANALPAPSANRAVRKAVRMKRMEFLRELGGRWFTCGSDPFRTPRAGEELARARGQDRAGRVRMRSSDRKRGPGRCGVVACCCDGAAPNASVPHLSEGSP